MHKAISPILWYWEIKRRGPTGIKSQLETIILQSTLDSAWGNNLNLKTYNP